MELETKLFPGPLLYRSPGMTEDTGQSLYRLNDAAGAPGFSKRTRFESGEGAEGGERGQVTSSGRHVPSGHSPSLAPRSQCSGHITGGNKRETVAEN